MEGNVFFCRMCGFTTESLLGCPYCEEPLVELSVGAEAEFQRNVVVRNAVGMLQDRKWY